ncbi:gamma-glutamyltransferase [Candidatus Pantoea edessiphila]|uniref:Gamma-glutamyltransferase n=1 Tax=Candidatus Pantoea edessiphila TaxID=2044610 RepID=A0A2P5SXH2_9GAMM|nr:gamma-glutamyltransferase family protein [Candidatus Pantoea edessiphila]MBK4775815.1 gamma-glutamyltransferase family protein [Pantoea sp. Edef]PPI87003.1 gamma-glutamyltransferase [Candidatus Pantoea edessiphila]
MIYSNMALYGMVVTPHHLASETAISILKEGGNAIEAIVAAAATIAVVYPHMNGLGGDGFWLIIPPDNNPIAIDASGAAGSLANVDFYRNDLVIPYRGSKAALTVAGTLSGWKEALSVSEELNIYNKSSSLPLVRLLNDAITYAGDGIPVSESQYIATKTKIMELKDQPGFASTFLPRGKIPEPGSIFLQKELAITLKQLALEGIDTFYKGNFSYYLAAQMSKLKIPITLQDLQKHQAYRYKPLHITHSLGDIWNTRPPSQGIVSLLILGIIDQLDMAKVDDVQTIHLIVEATKQAFLLRNKYLTDPRYITKDLQYLLNKKNFVRLANQINDHKALNYSTLGHGPSDTVWMGAIDKNGLAVSFIQSIYYEFGSGVVIPNTGIIWHNRGVSFSLNPKHILALSPGKKPFHTLSPAAARLKDNRIMVYGSMGGDGQPQIQAAIFNRYVVQKIPLQKTITMPRWIFGRTWGESSDSLKIEKGFKLDIIKNLYKLGHKIEILSAFSEDVGHAGAIVRHENGILEGASDPRCNGSATGF